MTPAAEFDPVTVAAVMQRDPPSVDPEASLAELVASDRPRDRLLVLGDGRVLGVLRDTDVEAVETTGHR